MVAQRVFILHARIAAESTSLLVNVPGREPVRQFKPRNKRQKQLNEQKSGKKKR